MNSTRENETNRTRAESGNQTTTNLPSINTKALQENRNEDLESSKESKSVAIKVEDDNVILRTESESDSNVYQLDIVPLPESSDNRFQEGQDKSMQDNKEINSNLQSLAYSLQSLSDSEKKQELSKDKNKNIQCQNLDNSDIHMFNLEQDVPRDREASIKEEMDNQDLKGQNNMNVLGHQLVEIEDFENNRETLYDNDDIISEFNQVKKLNASSNDIYSKENNDSIIPFDASQYRSNPVKHRTNRLAKLLPPKSSEKIEIKNDSIVKLMKATMINDEYKRDLSTNQILKASTLSYDQTKNIDKEILEEYAEQQSKYIEQINDIKKNKMKRSKKFLDLEISENFNEVGPDGSEILKGYNTLGSGNKNVSLPIIGPTILSCKSASNSKKNSSSKKEFRTQECFGVSDSNQNGNVRSISASRDRKVSSSGEKLKIR